MRFVISILNVITTCTAIHAYQHGEFYWSVVFVIGTITCCLASALPARYFAPRRPVKSTEFSVITATSDRPTYFRSRQINDRQWIHTFFCTKE